MPLEKMVSQKDKKTTINRYNNFGFREKWLQFYLEHIESFFENDENVLELGNSDSCATSKILKTTEFCTLKKYHLNFLKVDMSLIC